MKFSLNIASSPLLLAVFLTGSGLFLFFGIEILRMAYRLTDPFSFMFTFFAANFIILISLAIGGGILYRLWYQFRNPAPPSSEEEQD